MRSFCGGKRGKVFLVGYDSARTCEISLFAILCIFDPIFLKCGKKKVEGEAFSYWKGEEGMEDVGLQGKGGGREVFMMRDYLIYVLIYNGRTRGGLVAEKKRGESLTTRRRKSLGIEEGILSMQS